MAADAELRLGLVCYGGVSLAVYMHGVTKELHKLVRASREFDSTSDLDAANPYLDMPGADSETAYFEALRRLARDGHRLSVVIDIIAGTSAGGINGVCLAKVLARNGSQDRLKQLWIDSGDLKVLLNAPRLGGWRLRSALATARVLLSPMGHASPLRGDRMSGLLVDAITDMDAPVDERRTLLPPDGSLELFVTTTDLHGYEVLVPTGVGGVSQRERAHAQVLRFRTDDPDEPYGPASTGALAFSARATSSFPGAFPPVSLRSFAAEANAGRQTPVDVDTADIARRFAFHYDEAGTSAHNAWFVDGGVLDNAPFDLVVHAVGAQPAEREVVRRIVYIQPDPGRPLDEAAIKKGRPHEPGWLSGLWGSIATVKGSHSVLDELMRIRDMNTRIAQIAAIATSQADDVRRALESAWRRAELAGRAGADGALWDVSDFDDVRRLNDALHDEVADRIGIGYAGYCRLKAEAAGRRLADEISRRFVFPPDSSRTSFVRAAISAWARQRAEWQAPDVTPLMGMFGPVDLPYRERRLKFILAEVNRRYAVTDGANRAPSSTPGPSRAQLDHLKTQTWSHLTWLRQTPHDVVGEIPQDMTEFLGKGSLTVATITGDPAEFARHHREDFDKLFGVYSSALTAALGEGSWPLWRSYLDVTTGWPDDDRRMLLSSYLGFPLWDALIFPTIALSELPQFSPIGVSQFSPLTARALEPPADGKLKGVGMYHFAGFVDPGWRENDYLWGRLDAAELILRILRTAGAGGSTDPIPHTREEAIATAGAELLAMALRRILSAESGLRRIEQTRTDLTEQVDRLIR